jgi:hypothetical protein
MASLLDQLRPVSGGDAAPGGFASRRAHRWQDPTTSSLRLKTDGPVVCTPRTEPARRGAIAEANSPGIGPSAAAFGPRLPPL